MSIVFRRAASAAAFGQRHRTPALQRGQAPFQQEFGFALALRDRAHRAFVQARRQGVGFDVRHEAVAVGLLQGPGQRLGLFNVGHGGDG